MSRVPALAALVVLAGCARNPLDDFSRMPEEFVYTTLSFSPTGATQAGLHQYNGQNFDEMLDDFSPPNLDRQKQFYERFRDRLAYVPADSLAPQDRADYAILRDQTTLALLDLTEMQSALHSPTLYVETLGNAFFAPWVLEYAPKEERLRHIMARLEKVPLYLDQARTNLTSAPAVWTKVAAEENEGNIRLVDETIRAAVPEATKEQYAKVARPAIEAMKKFQTFLLESLATRNNADWRLGRALYDRKFTAVLAAGSDASATLLQAEGDLQKVRARMLELATPIHASLARAHGDHGEMTAGDRTNTIVGEVLTHIADRHSTASSYLADAKADLEEARRFVAARRFLTLPERDNLQVIETPEFMRGLYSVGGFNAAPPLEPQLGAFYWVTPIPKSWPADRAESKLREYNFYKLKLLTIHEAMPGHYVQLEAANAVEPKTRRLLRSVFGNGPYIEGWAQYATQMMLESGFLDQSPELRLTFLKEELRVLANAILDIRLHTLNMGEQEAVDFMIRQTFQEKEEATAKLQRAQLSSCQLPTYYVGWRAWQRLRQQYRDAKGSTFIESEFHDRALAQGAVPMSALPQLLR